MKKGKKRIIGMALLLAFSLGASPVFATEEEDDGFDDPLEFGWISEVTNFATKEQILTQFDMLKGEDWGGRTGSVGPTVKPNEKEEVTVYFGTKPDGTTPLEWWIAGADPNNLQNGLVLFAKEPLIGEMKFTDVVEYPVAKSKNYSSKK